MELGQTLILGARSLIGDRLEQADLLSGRRLLALSRRAPAASTTFEWIQGDLSDPQFALGLPPIDCVVSLCPIWLLPQSLPALLAKGARRIIAFSSTSKVTKRDSADPKERETALALACGEDGLIDLCEAAGATWTILRPTLIYDEGRDGNVTRLAGVVRRLGFLPLAGDGGGLRQPVHAEDLARAVLSVVASAATANRSYDLVGGDTLTYRAMAERIFAGLGRPVRIVSVPPVVWALAFRLGRSLLPGATQSMGARMSQDLTFDDSAARADFGWRPRGFHPRFVG